MGKILGIDLGTSNSAAAVFMGGKAVIIPSAEGISLGGKAFPSVIAFTKDGQRLIGEPARRQAISNPDRTIMAIKRKMGTDHKVTIDGKAYTPQEISAMLLRKIKTDAEAFVGEPITDVIITVPAYFNDNQRQATKDAGRIAGFNVKRLINEPTAAAFAYGLDKEKAKLTIAVLDLGGGTFDVTFMEMNEGVFEVVSTSGDTALGGTDMDKLLLDYIAAEFQREQGIDLKKDSMAMQRLREAVEKAKIELSSTLSTELNLPYITADSTGPKHLTMNLTRAKLEEIIQTILDKLESPILKAVKDSGKSADQIDKVILVGGPTRMPSVRAKFAKVLGKEPERGIDPMECVAMGASIQGGVLVGDVKDMILLDVTPLSLGVETLGGVFTKLIERNTTIPTKKAEIFSTAEDNQNAVTINVLQGERKMAQHNISLGRFNLVGIPPAPRGVPQIEVSFDIDANGILNVSAKDMGTGKRQAITISASNKMDEKVIQEKIREAERHADEDEKTKEMVTVKNQAESMIYQTEKLMKENADKVGDLKATIDQKILALKGALESNDISRMKSTMEDLQNSLHEVSQRMYQAQGGAPGPNPQQPQGDPSADQQYQNYQNATQEDDAVDVDYEVN